MIEPVKKLTAQEILLACIEVQAERGKEYDPDAAKERSFNAIAQLYTIITGRPLMGSDVALIQVLLKLVRQYQDQTRVHHDSVLDLTSYSSLLGELLYEELSHG